MSYATINTCAGDQALTDRVSAACAQEGAYEPTTASANMRWRIAAEGDVEAAYASALAAGNPAPGADESVVTDGMILSKVQSFKAGTPGFPEEAP
jgi:hypothetical protein